MNLDDGFTFEPMVGQVWLVQPSRGTWFSHPVEVTLLEFRPQGDESIILDPCFRVNLRWADGEPDPEAGADLWPVEDLTVGTLLPGPLFPHGPDLWQPD